MFYRVKLLAKLTLLVMLGGVDNIETRCKRRAPENYPFLGTRCGGHPMIKICTCKTHQILHCTMCILSSMFSFQPNKLRHILKVAS